MVPLLGETRMRTNVVPSRFAIVAWSIAALHLVQTNASATDTASESTPSAVSIEDLSFSSFESKSTKTVKSLTRDSRFLLAATGTGIPGTKGGSFVVFKAKDGKEYPGWIGEKGSPEAMLAAKDVDRGAGNTVNFAGTRWSASTLFRRSGKLMKPIDAQIETVEKDVSVDGADRHVTLEVCSGSKLLPTESRMLEFLGVAISGHKGRVKVFVDGQTLEGQVSERGALSLPKSTSWEPR